MNKVYVYGTLRPGNTTTVEVPGSMYDLGWFPGIRLGDDGCNAHFLCEVIEVTDEKLRQLDDYEGYSPNDEAGSLYLRKEYNDGFIYEYNNDVEAYKFIPGGDWLEYLNEPRGYSASMVQPKERAAA